MPAPSPSSRRHRPTEIDRLFLARRLAYPALERLGPVLTEDICVPRSAVPEMLARIRDTAAAHDVVIATIAHAGDGNLHPLIIAPEGDDAAKARAKRPSTASSRTAAHSAAPSPVSTASVC